MTLPHALIIVSVVILFACQPNVKHIYLNECFGVYRSRLTVQNGCRAPSVDPSLGTAGTSCRMMRCLLEAPPDRQYTSFTNFITPCGHTSVVLFPQTEMLERIISLIIIIQETVFSGAGAPTLHLFFISSRPWPKIKFPSDFSLF